MRKLYNYYWKLYQPDNILHATLNSIRGKKSRHDVQRMLNKVGIIETMQLVWELIRYEKFVPCDYKEKDIFDGKPRHLKIAPLVPDRIIHHCIIDVLQEDLIKLYIANTYACIKGRGIHACLSDVDKALTKDRRGTKYCLKIDIHHYYDSIVHVILKDIIAKSIGDKKLLRLLYLVIDSTEGEIGIPIGFLTSQHLANWYLTPFDHWMKETKRTKYYYRYMDDIVILSNSKAKLHKLLDEMRTYLRDNLQLAIKDNWQIFPVDSRSIDFVGYKSNHYNILARASILKRYWRKLRKIENKYRERGGISFDDAMRLLASHDGWLRHCGAKHYTEIMRKTFISLQKTNKMAQQVLYTGLLSDDVRPTFEVIDRIKGTTHYNFNQRTVSIEEERDGKTVMVQKNKYDSLVVHYPITRKHVFETLITAKYPTNEECKLINDYNAAAAGIEDESFKQPYLNYLSERKKLHAQVQADCAAAKIPEGD